MIIRNFDWRDFALMQRVRGRGICLHSQLNFTRGPHAIQNSLLEMLARNRSIHTLVARPDGHDDPEALGQVQVHEDYPQAHLSYIAPEDALQTASGLHLLDAIARIAGRRGCQSLVAEIPETAPGFESLRHAGFGVYARQRIWRLEQPSAGKHTPRENAWKAELRNDRSAIQGLYLNIVPALVQQVESPPGRSGGGLVYWQAGELLGYLDIHRGPRGVWIQPYLHPAANVSDDLFGGFLHGLSPRPAKPIYVCVRSYQGGVGGPLERLGFQPYNDQAVMVKRLAARVFDQVHLPLPAIEGTQPEATAPYAHYRQPPGLSRVRES